MSTKPGFFFSDMTIGFGQEIYNVYEQEGSVALRVHVLASNIRTRSVEVTFSTSSETATASVDDAPDFIDPGEVVLQFHPGQTFLLVNVSLINDMNPEWHESFFGYLKSSDPVVNIDLNVTEVLIIDLDSKFKIVCSVCVVCVTIINFFFRLNIFILCAYFSLFTPI